MGGEGLAIEWGLGSGELRIERDEREDEGLEGRVQDGERGELWVVLERTRPWEPVEVRREPRGLVAERGGSCSRSAGRASASALVGRLRRERVGPGEAPGGGT
jgi:hypothetical protein